MRILSKVLFVVALLVALAALAIVGGMLWLQTRWGGEFVRGQIETRLDDAVHGTVRVGRVRGNILTGITIEDLVIEGEDGVAFLRAGTVRASYRIAPFLDKRIAVDRVQLVRPEIRLIRGPDERWNFQEIFAREPSPPGPPGWGSWIRIGTIEIEDGLVDVKFAEGGWPVLDWQANEFRDLDGTVEVAIFSRDRKSQALRGPRPLLPHDRPRAGCPGPGRRGDPDARQPGSQGDPARDDGHGADRGRAPHAGGRRFPGPRSRRSPGLPRRGAAALPAGRGRRQRGGPGARDRPGGEPVAGHGGAARGHGAVAGLGKRKDREPDGSRARARSGGGPAGPGGRSPVRAGVADRRARLGADPGRRAAASAGDRRRPVFFRWGDRRAGGHRSPAGAGVRHRGSHARPRRRSPDRPTVRRPGPDRQLRDRRPRDERAGAGRRGRRRARTLPHLSLGRPLRRDARAAGRPRVSGGHHAGATPHDRHAGRGDIRARARRPHRRQRRPREREPGRGLAGDRRDLDQGARGRGPGGHVPEPRRDRRSRGGRPRLRRLPRRLLRRGRADDGNRRSLRHARRRHVPHGVGRRRRSRHRGRDAGIRRVADRDGGGPRSRVGGLGGERRRRDRLLGSCHGDAPDQPDVYHAGRDVAYGGGERARAGGRARDRERPPGDPGRPDAPRGGCVRVRRAIRPPVRRREHPARGRRPARRSAGGRLAGDRQRLRTRFGGRGSPRSSTPAGRCRAA